MASARRAGVYVPDDVDEWRAALLAADLTIGDHGSVTFYSAGLGTPILLASAPIQAVASDSPIAELLAAASELDLSRELEGQVRVAMAGADRDRLRAITDLATSQPGLAATRLRSVFYRLLELTEPDWAAEIDVIPLPSGPIEQAGAHLVWVRQTGPRSAVITRRPAERLRNDPWTPRGHHLAVSVVEARQRWLALADVVIGTAGTDTLEWIAGTLELMPGCQLATAPDAAHWLLGDRNGAIVTVDGPGMGPRLFGSVACAWLNGGDTLDDMVGDWVVTAGAHEHRIAVTPATATR